MQPRPNREIPRPEINSARSNPGTFSNPSYVFPVHFGLPQYVLRPRFNRPIILPPSMFQVQHSNRGISHYHVAHNNFRSNTSIAFWTRQITPAMSFPTLQAYPLPPLAGYSNSRYWNRTDYRAYRSVANLPHSGSFCRFCKSNGEHSSVYLSHTLKDSSGRNVCPIMRRHVCETCGATGDYAHTKSYCPKNDEKGSMKSNLLTPTMACGKKRRDFRHRKI